MTFALEARSIRTFSPNAWTVVGPCGYVTPEGAVKAAAKLYALNENQAERLISGEEVRKLGQVVRMVAL